MQFRGCGDSINQLVTLCDLMLYILLQSAFEPWERHFINLTIIINNFTHLFSICQPGDRNSSDTDHEIQDVTEHKCALKIYIFVFYFANAMLESLINTF